MVITEMERDVKGGRDDRVRGSYLITNCRTACLPSSPYVPKLSLIRTRIVGQ